MKRTQRIKPFQAVLLPLVLGMSMVLASLHYNCGPAEGGMNLNEQRPGNSEGGVDLGDDEWDIWDDGDDVNPSDPDSPDPDPVIVRFGAIAVDVRGRYFLTSVDSRLVFGDLQSGGVHVIESLDSPERVAFGNERDLFFITLRTRNRLVAYDPMEKTVLWESEADVDTSWPWIDVTKDDAFIILTYPMRVELRSAANGRIVDTFSFERRIEDVDLIRAQTPEELLRPVPEPSMFDSDDLYMSPPDPVWIVVTLEHEWFETGNDEQPFRPETEIHVLDPLLERSEVIAVPNCTSELVVDQLGSFGFLAPTRCVMPSPPVDPVPDDPVTDDSMSVDPVSVVDFRRSVFVRNLPGFGPVALSPKGTVIVAFMDMDNLDPSLFDDPAQIPESEPRYRIMVIDARDLSFESYPIGDELPRYAMVPDGTVLLVDFDFTFETESMRIMDLQTGEIVPVTGTAVDMDHYVLTGDSKWAYLLDSAESSRSLYELDIVRAVVNPLFLAFLPASLNITPDDAYLLIKDYDAGSVWQYRLSTHSVVREFRPPAL